MAGVSFCQQVLTAAKETPIISVATATNVHPAPVGRRHSKPRNGDLDFFEEHPMTALLYRGHAYTAAPATPKACVELTYRREHYNTCRKELIGESRRTLTYRGVTYTK